MPTFTFQQLIHHNTDNYGFSTIGAMINGIARLLDGPIDEWHQNVTGIYLLPAGWPRTIEAKPALNPPLAGAHTTGLNAALGINCHRTGGPLQLTIHPMGVFGD